MKATVRKEMNDAVTSYEEKPREKWIFDYPAQVCDQLFKIIASMLFSQYLVIIDYEEDVFLKQEGSIFYLMFHFFVSLIMLYGTFTGSSVMSSSTVRVCWMRVDEHC